MQQVGVGRRVEAESVAAHIGNQAGAGGVCGVEELVRIGKGSLLLRVEVLAVGGSKERADMVIEPPRQLGRGDVFEVDDRVFHAGKVALVQAAIGRMLQTLIAVGLRPA